MDAAHTGLIADRSLPDGIVEATLVIVPAKLGRDRPLADERCLGLQHLQELPSPGVRRLRLSRLLVAESAESSSDAPAAVLINA